MVIFTLEGVIGILVGKDNQSVTKGDSLNPIVKAKHTEKDSGDARGIFKGEAKIVLISILPLVLLLGVVIKLTIDKVVEIINEGINNFLIDVVIKDQENDVKVSDKKENVLVDDCTTINTEVVNAVDPFTRAEN